MPAFNCENYIAEALRSLQLQSMTDWEVIVVDDGSTDGTVAVAANMSLGDPRICLLRQAASGKPSISRNTGLEVAAGEFICFLDADDSYSPNKLARCLEIMDRYPNADLLFHDVEYVDANGTVQSGSYLQRCSFKMKTKHVLTPLGNSLYSSKLDLYFYVSTAPNSTLLTSSVLLKSNLVKAEKGFYRELTRGEDLDLWLRLLSKGARFYYLDEVLAYYRRHRTNLTIELPPIESDRITVHEMNYKRAKPVFTLAQRFAYRRFIATLYANGGFGSSQTGNYKIALNAFQRSLRWMPNWFSLKGCIKALYKHLPGTN